MKENEKRATARQITGLAQTLPGLSGEDLAAQLGSFSAAIAALAVREIRDSGLDTGKTSAPFYELAGHIGDFAGICREQGEPEAEKTLSEASRQLENIRTQLVRLRELTREAEMSLTREKEAVRDAEQENRARLNELAKYSKEEAELLFKRRQGMAEELRVDRDLYQSFLKGLEDPSQENLQEALKPSEADDIEKVFRMAEDALSEIEKRLRAIFEAAEKDHIKIGEKVPK